MILTITSGFLVASSAMQTSSIEYEFCRAIISEVDIMCIQLLVYMARSVIFSFDNSNKLD